MYIQHIHMTTIYAGFASSQRTFSERLECSNRKQHSVEYCCCFFDSFHRTANWGVIAIDRWVFVKFIHSWVIRNGRNASGLKHNIKSTLQIILQEMASTISHGVSQCYALDFVNIDYIFVFQLHLVLVRSFERRNFPSFRLLLTSIMTDGCILIQIHDIILCSLILMAYLSCGTSH